MPDWKSPQEIGTDAVAFMRMQHVLAGIFFWEFVASLDFEWSFLRGKRKFNYPMIPYFFGRYITLFTFIVLLITLDFTGEVNCQVLYQCLSISAQMMVALASMNLAIRTRIVILLSVLIAGHWGVVLSATEVKAQWSPGDGCVATQTRRVLLMLTYIYSLVFDATIFLLTAWKLSSGHHRRSRLVRLMFKDGLWYFLLVTVLNIPVVVFTSLDLNPVMNIMFNGPAATMSNVLACRAVRRLANFSDGPAIYMSTGTRIGPMPSDNGVVTNGISFATPGGVRSTDVHVQMDTFTVNDPDGTDYSETKDAKRSHGFRD
ncbi:hypothetical protein BXZ70DRAFT_1026395 [Cristinia sonorae]|uniref:Uncharacterized protein n=1 Tax=Cristinia sonorae TaxID=1940300 RepID=A0A8K0UPG0_9AGAR|nr:hypothetical protein BXZ70DRAFT_1026395 [Cristinia sonorae]